jgi:4-carboxymuconolactone decarboxylase
LSITALTVETAAREADIIGKPQRIESVGQDEFDDESLAYIRRIHLALGIETGSAVPDYFGLIVKHPGVFRCQLEIGTMFFKEGRLPKRERELAILRVGWLNRAPYEWGEHVDIGKRYGLTDEEVERVTIGSSAPEWNAHDRAILKGVEEMLSNQMISDEVWAVLAASWDEAQLIEFPTLVGQYVATGIQQNSLRVRLAPDNPGLGYR